MEVGRRTLRESRILGRRMRVIIDGVRRERTVKGTLEDFVPGAAAASKARYRWCVSRMQRGRGERTYVVGFCQSPHSDAD